MAGYNVLLRESVRKDLDSIPKDDLRRIVARIGNMAHDPRSIGCEKPTGQERYRICKGNYRIIYSIQGW